MASSQYSPKLVDDTNPLHSVSKITSIRLLLYCEECDIDWIIQIARGKIITTVQCPLCEEYSGIVSNVLKVRATR